MEAFDNFYLTFDAKAQKPFGINGSSSDESVGLLLRTKLYFWDKVTSWLEIAETAAKALGEKGWSTYGGEEQVILFSR